MTTTIKATKTEIHRFGTTVFFDILADDASVGEATLIRYYKDGDTEYTRLERLDIAEAHRGKGFRTAAIETMRRLYGRIVAAPDCEDSRRLYERIGKLVIDTHGGKEECLLDRGFGVYEFR
jgi:GNAT superfamily N-acetyltransferase